MRKPLSISATVGCVLGMATCGAAMAKQYNHHRHYRGADYVSEGRHHPLVVERRSFLDPGPVVPVGTYTQYVTQPAYAWGDPVSTYQRSRYMDENLHQAFDPQPVSPLVLPLQFWP